MSSGGARLHYSIKMLRERWEITKEQWSDQVARDFEKNHLLPIEQQTKNACNGMEKLSEVLHKMRRDCS